MSDVSMAPSDLSGFESWGKDSWLHFAKKAHRIFNEETGLDMSFSEFTKRQEAAATHNLILQAGGVEAVRYGGYASDPLLPEHVKASVKERTGELAMFMKRISGDIGSDDSIELNNRIRSERDQLMGRVAAPKEASPAGGTDKAPDAGASSGGGGE